MTMQIVVDPVSWLDERVTKTKYNVVAFAGCWMISAQMLPVGLENFFD